VLAAGHGEARATDGFFGHAKVEASLGPASPGGWYAENREVLSPGLQRLLSTLPAEGTRAGHSTVRALVRPGPRRRCAHALRHH
jgi:hypothetical protein